MKTVILLFTVFLIIPCIALLESISEPDNVQVESHKPISLCKSENDDSLAVFNDGCENDTWWVRRGKCKNPWCHRHRRCEHDAD